MLRHGIKRRTFPAYSPMSNGREERRVGTLKASIRKMVIHDGIELDKALDKTLYGYRRRSFKEGSSPFELVYGVAPRMDNSFTAPLL